MTEKFEKSKLMGATRQILFHVAVWTSDLFDGDASKRLVGDVAKRGLPSDHKWDATGSAGPFIERSVILGHMARVIDCINSSIWHGDPRNLFNTHSELTPFHILLEKWDAISTPDDPAVEVTVVSSVLQVLEIFRARVKLDLEEEPLELKQLAAIAGLAEKTVRMAAIGQDRNPDLVTFKNGSRTYVMPEEAKRWLAKKNVDYRPIDWGDDHLLPPVGPKSIDELGPYLRELREKSNKTLSDIAVRLGWENDSIQAYEALEQGGGGLDLTKPSFDEFLQLCQLLCVSESAELVRIIDRVLHPLILEKRISDQLPSSAKE